MLNLLITLWSTVSAIPYLCDLGGIEGHKIMAFIVYFFEDLRKQFPVHLQLFLIHPVFIEAKIECLLNHII